MEAHDALIRRVQSEIESVERKIEKAELTLQQVTPSDAMALQYCRKEKEQLRKKEEQLRKEKEQLRAEKLLLLSSSLETGARATTPGDAAAVFCIVNLVTQVHGQAAFPRGTGFAISAKLLFTARHNCVDDNHPADVLLVGAVREISSRRSLGESEIVELDLVASDIEEDWAIFSRREGDFSAHVGICSEEGLPAVRDVIGIKDYPVGLINSSSAEKLSVVSVLAKVSMYEQRPAPPSAKAKASFFVPVVKVAAPATNPTDEVVIMVSGGRVQGSCGAPYFNVRGEVVAFHFESVDDSESDSSAHSSHISFSHGYVLCRLPNFTSWYTASIRAV